MDYGNAEIAQHALKVSRDCKCWRRTTNICKKTKTKTTKKTLSFRVSKVTFSEASIQNNESYFSVNAPPEYLITERWGYFQCLLLCYLHGQGDRTGKIKICQFLQYVLNCRSSHIHTGCDHCKSDCLVKRLDCCVPRKGHSDGLKLHWLFISPTFFFFFSQCSFISLQTN